MLRITKMNGDQAVTLRLEGKLLEPWIGELTDACGRIDRKRRIVLDLGGVSFVDRAGVRLLRKLKRQGTHLASCSNFVHQLLQSERGSGEHSDDDTLLAQIREGDDEACGQFVRAHYAVVSRTAARLVPDPADRARAIREALSAAIDLIDTFDGRSSLADWVRRVAVRICLRHQRITASTEDADSFIADLQPRFDEVRRRDEFPETGTSPQILMRVRESISALPEPHRTLLLLRDVEGFTSEEIGDFMEMGIDEVKRRVHHARLALCEMLARVFTPNCAA